MTASTQTNLQKPVLVLFRHDLRVGDNRALLAAAASGKPVVPVFIFDELSPGTRPLGGARRWWLHHSLVALSKALRDLGAPLILQRGAMDDVVDALVEETGADMVLWNRRYDPPGVEADAAMMASLRQKCVETASFEGHLLHEPSRLKTGSGGNYRVYTPFWRALSALQEPRDPLPAPKRLQALDILPNSDSLTHWKLLPSSPDWAEGLRQTWTPGEAGAQARLSDFLGESISGYSEKRDRPDMASTSRLSPHLTHGEITPFQVWAALRDAEKGATPGDLETFRKELAWREFSWHLLFFNPELSSRNFNSDFDRFAWQGSDGDLKNWQQGRTGYPIVDAGMRQLWRIGWMHNRVRMVAASFLIKHLMVDWRQGEAWFWDTLVDADPANNPASWQWVAGSGADAAPYFRIFNPILQGQKFDPRGDYVRRHVPELKALPDSCVHSPWQADQELLAKSGLNLGKTYPRPIIDHAKARERALAEYQHIREAS